MNTATVPMAASPQDEAVCPSLEEINARIKSLIDLHGSQWILHAMHAFPNKGEALLRELSIHAVLDGKGTSDTDSVAKGPWREKEDKALRKFVSIHGEGKWQHFASVTGIKRGPASCKLRWDSYINAKVKRGTFTEDEDSRILKLVQFGEKSIKWKCIANQHFPGRTGHNIKMRWHKLVSDLRKKVVVGNNPGSQKDGRATDLGRTQLLELAMCPRGTDSAALECSSLVQLAGDQSPEKCVLESFEATVHSYTDDVAVTWGDQRPLEQSVDQAAEQMGQETSRRLGEISTAHVDLPSDFKQMPACSHPQIVSDNFQCEQLLCEEEDDQLPCSTPFEPIAAHPIPYTPAPEMEDRLALRLQPPVTYCNDLQLLTDSETFSWTQFVGEDGNGQPECYLGTDLYIPSGSGVRGQSRPLYPQFEDQRFMEEATLFSEGPSLLQQPSMTTMVPLLSIVGWVPLDQHRSN